MDTRLFLNNLAEEVRRLYCAHREFLCRTGAPGERPWGHKYMPRWDGGEDSRGVVHKSVWHKIARFLVDHRIEPILFMEAQFANRAPSEVLPPNLLYNQAALERFESLAESAERGLRGQWDTQFLHFATKTFSRGEMFGEEEGVASFRVLEDMTYDLSPLFRYCLAAKAEHGKLMAMHHLPGLVHRECRPAKSLQRETTFWPD